MKASKKERLPLTSRTWAKALAFAIAMVFTAVGSFGIIITLSYLNSYVYMSDKDDFIREQYSIFAEEEMSMLAELYTEGSMSNKALGNSSFGYGNVSRVRVYDDRSGEVIFNYVKDDYDYYDSFSVDLHNSMYVFDIEKDGEGYAYDVEFEVADPPVKDIDHYKECYDSANLIYGTRYWIFALDALSIVMVIACAVFLIRASGRHSAEKIVRAGFGTKFPLDLMAAFIVIAIILFVIFLDSASVSSSLGLSIVFAASTPFLMLLILGFIMSLALRIKLKILWETTLIYKLLRAIKRAAQAIIAQLPIVAKTAIVCIVTSLVVLIALLLTHGYFDRIIAIWAITAIAVSGVALYVALVFKKLKGGCEELARGNFSNRINTEKFLGDFKAQAEALNSIAGGMAIAVEKSIASERMKTELITNVSHDIKTPLTSIINYTDLICKEECDNEKIQEYSSVLLRQSKRLKRLIEDLIEASKASSGAIEINLAPCDAGIMLTQAAGEYEEKLKQSGLELITEQPESPVMINADGRRLFRVFDNLLNNACKYSQQGTRVYLSLKKIGERAVITIKNTSKAALNITPDELMERFVRGDSSRSTEGNGLGLSIAKSLTERQNGVMDITIDGDLFKVMVSFPTV